MFDAIIKQHEDECNATVVAHIRAARRFELGTYSTVVSGSRLARWALNWNPNLRGPLIRGVQFSKAVGMAPKYYEATYKGVGYWLLIPLSIATNEEAYNVMVDWILEHTGNIPC